MSNGWIVDVLTDLREFAEKNGLAALSDQLDQTKRVAMRELTMQEAPVMGGLAACEGHARTLHRRYSRRSDT